MTARELGGYFNSPYLPRMSFNIHISIYQVIIIIVYWDLAAARLD